MNVSRVRELAYHFEAGRRGETHFSAGLFRLVMKADAGNRERLRAGFPEEVAFVDAWRAMPNGERWISNHLTGRLVDRDYHVFGETIELAIEMAGSG